MGYVKLETKSYPREKSLVRDGTKHMPCEIILLKFLDKGVILSRYIFL